MKKITLFLLAFVAFQFNYAQDTCATAAAVTAGITTVAAIDGTEIPDPICAENGAGATAGEWYLYSATINGLVTVATNIPANDVGLTDTRVHIYTGTCGTLTCVGGNDDVDYDNTDYRSEASFNVVSGTDYYIAFDDRWNEGGFDFELTETPLSCLPPSNFVIGALGVTATSFDIEWTDDNGPGTLFDIEFGTLGFVLGTGTVINGIGDTTYNFTALTPDTNYEFYITANCTGGNGDSDQIGPIGFITNFDCASYGIPYTEDWSNLNAFGSCYTIEDGNMDGLSWLFNGVNDLDGNGTDDNIVNVFPQAANVAKDDWLFTPAIVGTMGTEYSVTVTYNAVNFNGTANESFDLVISDSPSAMATTQSVIGSYNNITQAGLFGDTNGNDLITQAYSSTATYTASADGDFHVGIHATTPALGSDVFFFLTIEVDETLSVDEFDSNNFTYSYNKNTDQLSLESSSMPFDSIEMYSILGQNVISRELSEQNEVIDLSGLTDGIYLATVNINGNTKTIKILKQ